MIRSAPRFSNRALVVKSNVTWVQVVWRFLPVEYHTVECGMSGIVTSKVMDVFGVAIYRCRSSPGSKLQSSKFSNEQRV